MRKTGKVVTAILAVVGTVICCYYFIFIPRFFCDDDSEDDYDGFEPWVKDFEAWLNEDIDY